MAVTMSASAFASGQAPVAIGKTLVVSPSLRNSFSLECADQENDQCNFPIKVQPLHGTVKRDSLKAIEKNQVWMIYTPEAGYQGEDSLTYIAWDGTNYSANRATINFLVRQVVSPLRQRLACLEDLS